MDYQGPAPDDLANIKALNSSFLRAISGSSADAFSSISTHKMSPAERTRLASAPFLLFSFRERDEEYWGRLLDNDPQYDLIDSAGRPDKQIRQLQVAGLSFLWQLARRNPYAVRLACGASVGWCEQLARLTLVDVLQRAGERGDMLRLRFADDKNLWRRLLASGIAPSYRTRGASHHYALQLMLTRRSTPQATRLSAAACGMRIPGAKTTQRSTGGIRAPKV